MKKFYWGLGIVLSLFLAAPVFNEVYAAKKPTKAYGKGLVRDKKKFKEFLKSATRPEKTADVLIPASGDLSGVASLPRNQGSCGSCWAYALTKSLQSELMIAGTSPSSLLDVSYLTGNCGGPVKMYGCSGGDFPAGQNFLNGLGPWANGIDPVGQKGCKNLSAAGSALSFVMLGSDSRAPSDLDMVQAMYQKHVLTIDVAADNKWSNYPSGTSDGVWRFNTSNGIDHMINRLGWKCATLTSDGKYCAFDANGNSAGIVYLDMNNWGEDWGVKAPNGHGGYIYETRLANQSGQSAAYFTVVQPPAPVPPPSPMPVINWASILTVIEVLAAVAGFAALGIVLFKK